MTTKGVCRIYTDVVPTSSLPYTALDYSSDLRRARRNAYCKGLPQALKTPTPLATRVKDALKRETDVQYIRRLMQTSKDPTVFSPQWLDEAPTPLPLMTEAQKRVELTRQYKRLCGK